MSYKEPECIQRKRKAAEAWYEKVKDMTDEERMQFYADLNRKLFEYADKIDDDQSESE
jgi:hypothetical protein